MIHIGYGDSATGCIREAIDVHDLVGDRVIVSRDDFTQGPLSECGPYDDFSSRISYWSMIDDEVSFGIDVESYYNESIELFDDLDNEDVVIWQGDSAHDILASAWVLYYLQHRNLKWHIVDLGKISPEDENDGLPAVNLAMFAPDQISDLYRYKQKLPDQSILMYFQLWESMVAENGAYRIKKDQQLLSVSDDYHDEFILSHLTKEWAVASQSIGQIIGLSNHSLTDTTIEWRIRRLIEMKKLEHKGNLKMMSEYKIRKV